MIAEGFVVGNRQHFVCMIDYRGKRAVPGL